jgi:hypothetical protein
MVEQEKISTKNTVLIPLGVEPGLIIIRNGNIIRETEYTKQDGDWGIYNVITDKTEYGLYTVGAYNVVNGMSYEQHRYVEGPEIRIYSSNNIPVYSTAVDENGGETLYSLYENRVATDESRHLYILIDEDIKTKDVSCRTQEVGADLTLCSKTGRW